MKATFGWVDYALFILMLVISSGMGIYHGLYKKQATTSDYLLGGKQMKVWPIALSLISSTLSGVQLISIPAEIYRYGITLILTSPLHILILIAAGYVYIPVFYQLQVTSIYEYFKERYNNTIRIFASFIYIVHIILAIPIYIYVPALALSQVSDVSVHYITPIVCGVCIFYTTIGGIKAAVWSDAAQFAIMFGSLLLVVGIGVIGTGGFTNIFEKFAAGNRMNISFDLSLTDRNTFWAIVVGGFFANLNHIGTNQGFVQKCLSLPSYDAIKRALALTAIGIMIITGIGMFSALVMFAHYFGCDPLKTNAIKTYDQLIPMYVMETASFIPGLPGLFISGIFSASLSSLSASLNCMAAIIYQDFLSPFLPETTSELASSRYLKALVVIFGVLCTILVYVVEKLGSILGLMLSASAISGGPLFGLFTAGMLIPLVHTKGALCGGIVSVILTSWIVGGAQWYQFKGELHYPPLPVSTESCNATILDVLNQTLISVGENSLKTNMGAQATPFILYRLSMFYYTMIGAFVAIFVSVVVSYFTERDKPLNKDCLSPFVRNWIKDSKEPQYFVVEKAMELVNKK